MTDPFSERFELFARTRERVGSGLMVALRLQLPQIADDVDEAVRHAKLNRDAQDLRELAFRLRSEGARRIDLVVPWLNERTLHCLELAGQVDLADAGQQAWRLVAQSELELQIAGADLTRQVLANAADFYSQYAGRIANLTQRQWPLDELLPLGATALSLASFTVLEGLTQSEPARNMMRQSALEHLPGPLAAVLRDAEAHLLLQGVQPWLNSADPAPAVAEPKALPEAPAIESANLVAASPSPTPDRVDKVAVVRIEPASQPSVQPTAQETSAAKAQADAEASAAARRNWAELDALERSVKTFEQDIASTRKLASSPIAGVEPNRLRVLPTLQTVNDIERDAVAFAHSIGAIPYSREARHAFFDKVRTRLSLSGAPPAQLAEVDLVTAMFDYVIDDRRLPDASRPLIWRLHQPVVALSLLDPGYLADDPRSLRKLIENFGAIATSYSEDMIKDGELYRRLETVVRAVEIVAAGLQTRSAVIAQQVDREYLRASRSVSKLVNRVVTERNTLESVPGRRNRRDVRRRPGREREREVTEMIRTMLADRARANGAPESVNEFLQSVWSRHLRTAFFRDGEGSEQFKSSLGVVDDLLWTLDGESQRHSRNELANRIPTLIGLLNHGIREVDAKDNEYKAFFDELFLIHLHKMQHRSDGGRKKRRASSVHSKSGGTRTDATSVIVTAIDPKQPVAAASIVEGQPMSVVVTPDEFGKGSPGSSGKGPDSLPVLDQAVELSNEPPKLPSQAASSDRQPVSDAIEATAHDTPFPVIDALEQSFIDAPAQSGAAADAVHAGQANPAEQATPAKADPASEDSAKASRVARPDRAEGNDSDDSDVITSIDPQTDYRDVRPARYAGRPRDDVDGTEPLATTGAWATDRPASGVDADEQTDADEIWGRGNTRPGHQTGRKGRWAANGTTQGDLREPTVPPPDTANGVATFGESEPPSRRNPTSEAHTLADTQDPTASHPTSNPRTRVGSSSAGLSPELPDAAPPTPPAAGEAPDHRLIEVLNSLDLSDAPLSARRIEVSAEAAVHALVRGSWLEITSNDGKISDAKVAWINPRRTVVLLVRHPDRKALSLRMTELRSRFDRGRAFLLH